MAKLCGYTKATTPNKLLIVTPHRTICRLCSPRSTAITPSGFNRAKNPHARQTALIRQIIAATSCPVQVGGGIRGEQDVAGFISCRRKPRGDRFSSD